MYTDEHGSEELLPPLRDSGKDAAGSSDGPCGGGKSSSGLPVSVNPCGSVSGYFLKKQGIPPASRLQPTQHEPLAFQVRVVQWWIG